MMLVRRGKTLPSTSHLFMLVWIIVLTFMLSQRKLPSLQPGMAAPSFQSNRDEHQYDKYIPGREEALIFERMDDFGFNNTNNPPTCVVYSDPDLKDMLSDYVSNLDQLNAAIDDLPKVPNLQPWINRGNYTLCGATRAQSQVLNEFFPGGQLSFTSSGYIEPLLPPLRHPTLCKEGGKNLMRMDFLVHDFEQMCLSLKPHSRLVLVDLGASFTFHVPGVPPPIVWLLERFEKMGFHFDHIFGYEVTFIDPIEFYSKVIPEKYMASYHWINVGVSPDKYNRLNPLESIIKKFEEDDLVLVKLDVDQPDIEIPLVLQLVEDETLAKLIDHFYFEHHVHLGELAGPWSNDGGMRGTVKESLELFTKLREKGIAAHSWP